MCGLMWQLYTPGRSCRPYIPRQLTLAACVSVVCFVASPWGILPTARGPSGHGLDVSPSLELVTDCGRADCDLAAGMLIFLGLLLDGPFFPKDGTNLEAEVVWEVEGDTSCPLSGELAVESLFLLITTMLSTVSNCNAGCCDSGRGEGKDGRIPPGESATFPSLKPTANSKRPYDNEGE